MGKQSTRENKTIYQICREEAGLTRLEASEKMTAVSDSKIEKFEYEMQEPTPYDIIQIARDGKISDDEIRDFAFISNKLDEISLAIDSLNLWVDKTAGEQGLNIELFREEKEKQK